MTILQQFSIITLFLFSSSVIASSNCIQFSMQANQAQRKAIIHRILDEQIQKIEVIHHKEKIAKLIKQQDKAQRKEENRLYQEKQKNMIHILPDWLQTAEYGALKNKYAKP